MTFTTDNTEELYRFASTRAPSDVPQPEGLLELADDTDVPQWLASAAEQEFSVQLDSLEGRWRALTGGDAEERGDLLLGSAAHEPQASATLFPVAPARDSGAALDALMTGLWKFYLQGISSGKANAAQLKRAQQLMGQASLLQSVAGSKEVAPVRLAAALNPTICLPAAFEQQMRMRRGQEASQRIGDDSAQQHLEERRRLNARLAQLDVLEQDLVAAIEQAGPSETPPPFSLPVTKDPSPEANSGRRYHFQPAADLGQRFRNANDLLMHALDEAQIASAGKSPYQLLDEVRRQMAELTLAVSRLPVVHAARPPVQGERFGIRPVGVADLRVVRQVLLGYDKGELAHIDNVVHGETRERHHSELKRTEESDSEYSDRGSETWRENQSADRFELGRFTYTTARESQDSNSSINISGTYGEVTINASTFMGASRGRDETIGEDQRRSREVIERALQLTRESVGRFRWTTAISEVQDTTIHKQKAKCGHLVAQYRWVDKVYQAQVYNVGARAMYEVIVPAPAALFTQLLARQPGLSAHAGPAPARPTLQAAEITDTSWVYLAAQHGVTLPAPPAAAITEFAQASHAGGGGFLTLGGAHEQGYQATSAGCSMSWYGAAEECGVTASIGTLLFSSSVDPEGAIGAQALATQTGAVNYSASAWGAVEQYTVNFYLVWTRTQRSVEQWQHTCHRIIMDDYEVKLARHRERQAVALSESQMRGIERTELKRAILEIVRTGGGQGAPAPAIDPAQPHGIDVDRLEAAAREVRFFEYAFEWDQITYRFMPYFWNAQQEWNAEQFGQQGDNVFRAFLSAGFASVILPVRKGFEDAAALYLQTGLVLDLPVVPADAELANMNREVALINASVEDGVAEGEAWTYRVPTTLVLIDDGTSGMLPQLSATRI